MDTDGSASDDAGAGADAKPRDGSVSAEPDARAMAKGGDGSASTGTEAGPDAPDANAGDAAILPEGATRREGGDDGAAHGDAGGDAPGSDSGTGNCTPTTCPSPDVCIETQVVGGAIIVVNDAGKCPAGTEPANALETEGRCMSDPTTSCAARPAGCGSAVTCACAATLCPISDRCVDSADASFITCEEAVP